MLPDNLSTLRVVDLKAELVKRKLSTKGKKDELVARLQQYIDDGNETSLDDTNDQDKDQTTELASVPQQTEPEASVEDAPEKEASTVKLVEAPVATVTAAAVPSPPATAATEEKEPVLATAAEPKSGQNVIAKDQPAPELENTQKLPETTEAVTAKTSAPPKEPVKASQGECGEKRKREEEKNVQEAHEKRNKTKAVGDKKQQLEQADSIKSTAIYIKGFVRPLITRNVQELIKQYGEVKRFWMDSIKTHCYVIYGETAQAIAAYKGIHGNVFPEDSKRKLTVGGLTPEQAEILIEQEQKAAERRIKPDWEALIISVCKGELSKRNDTTANAPEGRRPRLQGISQITRELQKAATTSSAVGTESTQTSAAIGAAAAIAVEERSMHETEKEISAPVAEMQAPPPPPAPTASLDELFRKTTTLPHLYYLPVSEQVAQEGLAKFQQRSSA